MLRAPGIDVEGRDVPRAPWADPEEDRCTKGTEDIPERKENSTREKNRRIRTSWGRKNKYH